MRLSMVLAYLPKTVRGMRYKWYFNTEHVPGKQWTGKHRRWRPITLTMKRNTVKRLRWEAETEKYLSTCHLSQAEEACIDEESRAKKASEEYFDRRYRARMPAHKFIQDQLDHLNINKRWADPQEYQRDIPIRKKKSYLDFK
ncbi:ribosomal protein 63, mitochondrial-like [Branchiostoma floridae]|nr:ribosomal protein 63, mitochondrial-like [Branchiostoma floridae]